MNRCWSNMTAVFANQIVITQRARNDAALERAVMTPTK
jgi:hypothetical protein